MNQYQTTQLLVALAFVAFGAGFIIILQLSKRSGQPPPIIYYGFGIAILTAFAFWLADVTSPMSPGSKGQIFDVVVKYIRDLPISLIVLYVSLMQTRKYRRARKRGWLNTALQRSRYILPALFLCSLLLDLAFRPPVLVVNESISVVVSLYSVPFLIALIVLSGLNALVFWSAFRDPIVFSRLLYSSRLRFQNLCGTVLSLSLAALACTTLTWYVHDWTPVAVPVTMKVRG